MLSLGRCHAERLDSNVVSVEGGATDRYGRTVGEVILPGGASLNVGIVEAGLAWWYRRYAGDDVRLRDAEAVARAARRGLWADPNPVPPWEWRKGKR